MAVIVPTVNPRNVSSTTGASYRIRRLIASRRRATIGGKAARAMLTGERRR